MKPKDGNLVELWVILSRTLVRLGSRPVGPYQYAETTCQRSLLTKTMIATDNEPEALSLVMIPVFFDFMILHIMRSQKSVGFRWLGSSGSQS